MSVPEDAVLPVLKRIQEDVAAIRKEQKAAKERQIELTEAVLETRDTVSEVRKDNMLHLGLTTKHRLEFEELRDEMKTLQARVAALESRS
jgi:outer membrane murein-binding lipoprotein Lpp